MSGDCQGPVVLGFKERGSLAPPPLWVPEARALRDAGMTIRGIAVRLRIAKSIVRWWLMPEAQRVAENEARRLARPYRASPAGASVTQHAADVPDHWVKRPVRRLLNRDALKAALADGSLASMPVDEIMRRITP